jgi:hypothetical protein
MQNVVNNQVSYPVPTERRNGLDYIFLDAAPEVPAQWKPTRSQCSGYDYMSMVQLCNIAEKFGMTRSFACNAFGGDKGKYKVEPARMARAVMIGNILRKFVLTSAVAEFFSENNIPW